MWQDPVVAETRALRKQYAKSAGQSLNAVFADVLRRQEAPGKRLVSFHPRKPVNAQAIDRGVNYRESEAGLETGQ